MSGLRVISGKARGRRLHSVPGDITRPITDRAKESLFNIISSDIENASLLDLFAGTGSVGIEALSRGASFVRFVDRSHLAIETIRSNLKMVGFESGFDVIKKDSFTLIEQHPDRQFDYIFIAPPQYKGMWLQALQGLERNPGWISMDAWVIVQIDPVEYQHTTLDSLHEFEQRRYGSTLFVFYDRK